MDIISRPRSRHVKAKDITMGRPLSYLGWQALFSAIDRLDLTRRYLHLAPEKTTRLNGFPLMLLLGRARRDLLDRERESERDRTWQAGSSCTTRPAPAQAAPLWAFRGGRTLEGPYPQGLREGLVVGGWVVGSWRSRLLLLCFFFPLWRTSGPPRW